jgi:transcriptional regulator with XRE-family HTH domain
MAHDAEKLAAQAARLQDLKRLSRRTFKEIAEGVHLTERQVQRWFAGDSEPNRDNLAALAAYFETTEDFIEYGVEERETPDVMEDLSDVTQSQLDRLEATQQTILRELRELRDLLRDLALEELEQVLREAAGRQQQRPADSSATDNS